MKFKYIMISILSLFVIVACNRQEEHYEKRDVKVESVFDNISISDENKDDTDKDKKAEDKKNEQEAKKAEEEKKKQEEQAKNNSQANNDNDQKNQNEQVRKSTSGQSNLRESPRSDVDNYILTVPENTNLVIEEEVITDGVSWSKVTYEGTTGYIRSDLLR